MSFVHLHVHSEYSTLDGMGKIRELFETAKSHGQNALAISDHGTSAGAWEAQQVADEMGMKMIHAQEFYYEREGDGKNGHLLILAKNDEGLRNIFRMQEIASVQNFYYKPRINWEILKAHSEGLIVTSACLGSPFNQYLINGEHSEAVAWARKFQEVFGEDFYIEIQPNDIPEQYVANSGSIRIAKQLGIELVATNDVHYSFETDQFPHEVLLALQLNKKMSNEDRFKFPDNNFWLKSAEEMVSTFQSLDEDIVRQAMATTVSIAEKCNARIEKGKYLPQFYNVPEGKTARNLLVEQTMAGARQKGLSKNADFMRDVQNEINIIDEEGYSDYFLIVQDYITSAKARGELVGDGRGSGSGSKVAYLSGIHEIPPHEFDLLFERFMAKGREPDIDTDFSNQDAVFADLAAKYGEDSVARIATYGRMTPKAVIRKVLNSFEVPPQDIGAITKLVPDLCPTLEKAYSINPALLQYKEKYRVEWEVIERLENVISHVGQHAGGVIIYPNLSDYIPLITKAEDRTKRIAAFDMDVIHDIGFFKFDILGLETIKDIHRCVESIKETTGEILNLDEIDYEDQATYDTLCRGDVSGVFQLAAQSTKVIEQQPRNFRDLIAINALIRPGVGDWEEYLARRAGKQYSTYEARQSYMAETVGTMTYQEQYLLDAHHLAGWGIAYADKHIRKNEDIRNDTELRAKFISDCTTRGHAEDVAEGIWEEIEDAVDGGYGFNKSHSASYGRLSFKTAYLKTHYPEHFYASLMSGEKTDGDGQTAIAGYIAECKRRGIQILPPDINNSGDNFVIANGGINYRITTIKHVGESAIAHINELRPIASFADFLERREKKHIKKNVMVNLIKAGAFDFDNPNRAELLWQFDMSERTKTAVKEGVEAPKYPWNDRVKCEWEQEVLGMYLSVHPMEQFGFKPLSAYRDAESCLQGGEVKTVFEFHPQKNPSKPKMAFITVDTLHGHVKLVVWASVWEEEENRNILTPGNLVLIRGKRSGNDMTVDSVEQLEHKE